MSLFVRFDRADYTRLAKRDRWSAGEVANLYVNAKKDIDGGFRGHCWRESSERECFGVLGDLLVLRNSGKLTFYGAAGNLGPALERDCEIIDSFGDLDAERVFILKERILEIFEGADKRVARRVKGLLDGKYWQEPRGDVSEEDLVKILAKRLIDAELNNGNPPPKIAAIMKELNFIGFAQESKSTIYDWIGEIYPK